MCNYWVVIALYILFFTNLIENFEKMRHPTLDVASIFVTTFTIRRKGLKPSYIGAK